MDHLHVMNQIVEKSEEYDLTIYLAFVDFEKAFDSVKHNYLLSSLRNQGI